MSQRQVIKISMMQLCILVDPIDTKGSVFVNTNSIAYTQVALRI